MEHCSSLFVFQCSFGAGPGSGRFSSPEWFRAVVFKHSFHPPHPHCFFIPHSTDLISVDGCLEGAHGWVVGTCQPWKVFSIWGLAGHSGSPWIAQAPTFHLSKAEG